MIRSLRLARPRYWWVIAALGITTVLIATLTPLQQARADGAGAARLPGSQLQRAEPVTAGEPAVHRPRHLEVLRADVDPATSLPMDNLTFAGGSDTPTTYGRYTSAANIGVYLWAVVSARDLGLVSEQQAQARIEATLTEVSHLQRYDGFLYQWYDTTNGDVLTNPGAADCAAGATPAFD